MIGFTSDGDDIIEFFKVGDELMVKIQCGCMQGSFPVNAFELKEVKKYFRKFRYSIKSKMSQYIIICPICGHCAKDPLIAYQCECVFCWDGGLKG
jgi:hypothetical protein